MNENLTKLLDEEISRELEQIENLASGSKEQTQAINNVTKLYQLTIDREKAQSEIKKMTAEHRLALKKQKDDHELKLKEYELAVHKQENDHTLKIKECELNELKRKDDVSNHSLDSAKQTKENIFKWCIGVSELVLPLIFYAVWMRRGFEFEKSGTYTSTTFRGLFNNFKPVKK